MEGRKLKINFFKNGSGSISSKANLPILDFRDMGVTPEEREVFYHYNKDNEVKVMILSKEDLKDYDIIIKKKNK